MQLRYATDLSIEDYVRTRAWQQVQLDCCPFHPQGGCGFAGHGAYLRKFPLAALVPRWYCPQQRQTVSLLPDFFASRLPGTLDEVELAATVADDCPSQEEAAELLRPEITLPAALRWLRRRLGYVRLILVTAAGLLLPATAPNLASFRRALGSRRVLVALRGKAGCFLRSLPPILGFGPRQVNRWPTKTASQQSLGTD